jgi:hypothetical protein
MGFIVFVTVVVPVMERETGGGVGVRFTIGRR